MKCIGGPLDGDTIEGVVERTIGLKFTVQDYAPNFRWPVWSVCPAGGRNGLAKYELRDGAYHYVEGSMSTT